MRMTGRTDVMKIESEKHRMAVHKVDLAGLRIDQANLAGASIVNTGPDGATIDGIALTDFLASWRAGHGAISA